MAHLVHVHQDFDVARYGSIDFAWTDDAGSFTIDDISTGLYRHMDADADTFAHPDGTSVTNAAAEFAPVLEAAIDAKTTQTPTVSYDYSTNRYTLAMSGSVFSVTWTGAAQLRMRALLGFSGNLSGATSYTGTVAPYFTLEPTRAAITGWTEPRAVRDAVSSRRTSSGILRTVGPALVPYSATWDHTFQSDADTLTAYETRFSWQTFWKDAGRYGRTCYLFDVGSALAPDLRWAFQLNTPVFDDSTHRREKPELRNRWRVTVDALLRGAF